MKALIEVKVKEYYNEESNNAHCERIIYFLGIPIKINSRITTDVEYIKALNGTVLNDIVTPIEVKGFLKNEN